MWATAAYFYAYVFIIICANVSGESHKFIEEQRFNCANLGQAEGKDAARSQRSVKSCDNLRHMDFKTHEQQLFRYGLYIVYGELILACNLNFFSKE